MNLQLKLALRSIIRGRFYSLLSVAGLSIAIAVVLLVALLIQRETSYDRGFDKAESIYRLTWTDNGTGNRFATMFNPFSPQMNIEFDEVLETARLGTFELTLQRSADNGNLALSGEPARVDYENIAMVDPEFFSLFNFEFVAGDAGALQAPNSVVMTRAGAEQYFPGEDPIGKTLLLENRITLTVTGLLRDIPVNSHFTPHYFVPLETLRTLYDGLNFLDYWGSDRFYHYVLLAEGVVPGPLAEQLPSFLERHDHEWPLGSVDIQLQPLSDIHFTTDLQDDMPVRDTVHNIIKAPRQASDLLLFSTGAFFLILVASFNFMNLQIARSVGRGRQTGMLKVLGANRHRVVGHMLLESVVLCMVSLGLALIIVEMALEPFSRLLAVTLNWSELLKPGLAGFALVLTLGLGLLSGAYPALLMASQRPSQVMKGEFRPGQGAAKIRSLLVLLQFTVSVVLIVVSVVIYAQIQFSLKVPLGFESENIAVLDLDRRTGAHYDSLRTHLLGDPRAERVSRGTIIPTGNLSDGTSLKPMGSENELAMRMVLVDHEYFETLGIDILHGRPYLREFPADEFIFPSADAPLHEGSIIINETAAQRAGWVNDGDSSFAIGQILGTEHSIDGINMIMRFKVVGVARDVHFRSLRSEIVPMAYHLRPSGSKVVVRFADGADRLEATALIQNTWGKVAADVPLRMNWLEDSVDELYAQEHRTLRLVASIALLAIVVACLGLLAVATLVSSLRTKEIGVRKILGAGIRQIINLLSWQFVKPVLLASLIAWPIAWIYLSDWLQLFAYRVDLEWMYFALPGLVAVAIAWLTVAGQAWRIARSKPINALRYE